MLLVSLALFAQKVIAPLASKMLEVLPLLPTISENLRANMNEMKEHLSKLVERSSNGCGIETHTKHSEKLENIDRGIHEIRNLLDGGTGNNRSIGSRSR